MEILATKLAESLRNLEHFEQYGFIEDVNYYHGWIEAISEAASVLGYNVNALHEKANQIKATLD
ncbi:hypothetical protein FH966_00600 [Lentibacillus cibarius]|uniref:Uncharacterized protein n=1 Tax=Lentibacillus cibarius TaxID=2583219 RepID=A0A549YEM8_9BACI|nr:hypothetical protein [Lentibacillus cibarius]TRM10336.1 hypothetical protein FH966_00600 [Lentibacillus cibarius]